MKSIVLVGKSDKKKRIFKTISIVIQNVALATPGGGEWQPEVARRISLATPGRGRGG